MKRENFPARITIAWLKYQYENQKLTPEKLVDELLTRRAEHEEYNIWIRPLNKNEIMKYIENLQNIDKTSPLWGIPFAIKDNIDLAGIPTTAGCPEYAYTPETNATVVDKLMAAGAIPMGKTNLDQFATGLVGTRSPYGEVHNSLRQELISGGSSAGSSVSVALGEAVFALGTDTAGSGRVPAALNQLVGLKPRVGAWSNYGLVPACASLDCITVFAEKLEDVYQVDVAVRGKDDRDCYSKEVEIPNSIIPQRVLLPKTEPIFYGTFEVEYRIAWKKAVERIKSTGVLVEYVDTELFSKSADILYGGPWVAERWAELREFVISHPEDVLPVIKNILESAAKPEYDAASVFTAMHQLKEYRAETVRMMKKAVLIMPTCGGTYTRDEVSLNPIETNNNMGLYTNHCNLLDLAAVAIPADSIEKDLPFGITVFSLAEEEGLIRGFVQRFEETVTIELAVCGLHMRGFSLEHQLINLGAVYSRTAKTSANYKMFCMDSVPVKPVMINEVFGAKQEVEIWKVPAANYGRFIELVQAPLALGRIKLEEGIDVIGFIGQMNQSLGEDITQFGGWRYYQSWNKK